MALAPIICAKGQHRISPSTALKDVNGEIWCEDCVSKSIEGKIENNPSAEVGNYYKSMNLDLEKAKWSLRFEPNCKSKYTGNIRANIFDENSYLWMNKLDAGIPDKYMMEIAKDANWKLWLFDYTNYKWNQSLLGNVKNWAIHWPHIDAQYSLR